MLVMLRKFIMRVRREDDSFVVKESWVMDEVCEVRIEELLGMVIGVMDRVRELWKLWLGVEWFG